MSVVTGGCNNVGAAKLEVNYLHRIYLHHKNMFRKTDFMFLFSECLTNRCKITPEHNSPLLASHSKLKWLRIKTPETTWEPLTIKNTGFVKTLIPGDETQEFHGKLLPIKIKQHALLYECIFVDV